MSSKRKKPTVARARPDPVADPGVDLLPLAPAPRHHWWLAGAVVFALAVVAYWPTVNNDFVNWDDHEYLTENDYVAERGGLARIWDPREQHRQFYPMVFSSYWLEHKLTLWLRGQAALDSYAGVDPADRGFEPRIHHATNLVLHAACAALVVCLLRLLGVSPWVGLLTAALFALHPINVASVAWVAERKNTLSTLFYLLSLICYVRNTRQRGMASYGLCLALFTLALLSKSATVTLPVTAALCDRLILRRWSWGTLARIGPMLPLAVMSAYLTKTIETANAGASMVPLDPLLRPLAAAGAVWFYLGKLLLPVNLAGLYPRWDLVRWWPVFLAGIVALVAAAGVVWKLRRRIPGHILWGLGYFLVTLTPMLGLISFSYTRYSFVANHFVYLPSIGVFLALAVTAEAVRRRAAAGGRPAVATAIASVVLVAAGAASLHLCRTVWKNGETFWSHTVALNPACWVGHFNLANIHKREADRLEQREAGVRGQAAQVEAGPQRAELLADAAKLGQEREALLRKALEGYGRAAAAKPDFHRAYGARGDVLLALGNTDEAIAAYRAASELESGFVTARNNLAALLQTVGRTNEAIEQYQRLLEQTPDSFAVHLNLGRALYDQGRFDEAVERLNRAVELDPRSAAAHNQLGLALRRRGDINGAIEHYKRAIELDPAGVDAQTNLALLLVRLGKFDVAASGFEHVMRIKPGFPNALIGMGLARAGQGRLAEAVQYLRSAVESDPQDADTRCLLAEHLLQLGEVEEALAEYREALRLDPDSTTAQQGLRQALERKARSP